MHTHAGTSPAARAAGANATPKQGGKPTGIPLSAIRQMALECVHGDRPAAAVLERIWFWHPKARHIDAQGQRWLIRTAQEFIDDGVPYSKCTIWRALRKLRELDLIETKRSYHHMATGKMAVTHIRIKQKVSQASEPLKVSKLPTSKLANCPLQSEQDAHFLYTGELQVDDQVNTPATAAEPDASHQGDSSEVLSPTGAGDQKPKVQLAEKEGLPKSNPNTPRPTIDQILATAKAKQPPVVEKLNAMVAHQIFSRACKGAWPQEVPPGSDRKRLKWLKDFLAKMRDAGVSDPAIADAIRDVVLQYADFREFVRTRIAWKLSERPTHLMFVQQAEQIRQYCLDAKGTSASTTGPKRKSAAEAFAEKTQKVH